MTTSHRLKRHWSNFHPFFKSMSLVISNMITCQAIRSKSVPELICGLLDHNRNCVSFFFFAFFSVLSARVALGQVQPALEHRPLHWGHLPQEQKPLGGCQRLQLHLPRHRVLGVSYIRAHTHMHTCIITHSSQCSLSREKLRCDHRHQRMCLGRKRLYINTADCRFLGLILTDSSTEAGDLTKPVELSKGHRK